MPEASHPDLAVTPAGDVWLTYTARVGGGEWGLYYQKSSDDGATWSPPARIQDGFCCQRIAGTPEGLVLTWWQGRHIGEPFHFHNEDVYYRTTTDEGATWSAPVRYTRFPGEDVHPNVTGLDAGGFVLAWRSDRQHSSIEYTRNQAIWFGEPAVHQDISAPPVVVRLDHEPLHPRSGDEAYVMATIAGRLGTADVEWSIDGVPQPDVIMAKLTTGRYRASLGVMGPAGVNIEYMVRAEDIQNNVMRSDRRGFEVVAPPEVRHSVLLVVDDTSHEWARHVAPYYRRALDDAGVKYDYWDASRLGPPFEGDLEPYIDGGVIYAVPRDDAWLFHHPDWRRVTQGIAAFMRGGGSAFFAGQEIAEHFRHRDPEWLATYLHAAHGNCCGTNQIEAIPGRLFPRGLSLGLQGGDGADNSWSPDAIRPVGGAETVLRYLYQNWVPATGPEGDAEPNEAELEPQGHEFNSEIAAIRHRDGQSRLVFFAFSFESISSAATRAGVMRYINPTCMGRASTIDGTAGDDVINGTAGNDVIVGFGGDDQLSGFLGDDTICGGPGDDIIDGGRGNDRLKGGFGDDTILGRPGNDWARGGPGRDLLRGGPGSDRLWGDNGADLITGGPGPDRILGGNGNDRLHGNGGDDLIKGGPGADGISCGAGNDIARGGTGSDTTDGTCEITTGIP